MPVEYGQRRGMGYRYSQDPAQQDWQQELALQYAGLPARRALVENARQFDASQKQQKKQFNTTNTLNETRFQQQRKDADKAGMLSGLGSLAGVIGAYAGTREGGIGSMLPTWMGGNNQTGARRLPNQYAPWGEQPVNNQQDYTKSNVAFNPYKPAVYDPMNSAYSSLNSWNQKQDSNFMQDKINSNDFMAKYVNNSEKDKWAQTPFQQQMWDFNPARDYSRMYGSGNTMFGGNSYNTGL